ncbi:hypothetical protein [Croceiramulus getboli]|nr:RsiV family protein [Flavobacteriaceae bacterium YJPT1-3]
MKTINKSRLVIWLFSMLLLLYLGCQKNQNKTTEPVQPATVNTSTARDTVDALTSETALEWQQKNQALKKEGLLRKQDDRKSLQEDVLTKELFEETDDYVIDYRYPYLNEERNAGYSTFNAYMKENYLDLEKTREDLLEDRQFLCDTINGVRIKEQRLIDFKIHATANDLISILLYKENYYSGMAHSAYTFDCLNYDVNKQDFIYFDDFFVDHAQREMLEIINRTIEKKITSGDLYIACWELAPSDFQIYKNNFVVNGEAVEFYFDDCIICPAYTGTYSIAIPLPEVLHLIREFQKPLLT